MKRTITLTLPSFRPFLLVLLLAGMVVGLAGCNLSGDTNTNNSTTVQQQGQQQNANAYSRLSQADPAIQMTDSLARKEINQRYSVFNNATGYGYFYGFIQGVAQPVIEYVVRGAVFPVDDNISPPNSVVGCPDESGSSYACGAVVSAPQPDGTFNTNGAAMFGFTADGVYFEWLGPYAYGTQPLRFQPLVVSGCVKAAQC